MPNGDIVVYTVVDAMYYFSMPIMVPAIARHKLARTLRAPSEVHPDRRLLEHPLTLLFSITPASCLVHFPVSRWSADQAGYPAHLSFSWACQWARCEPRLAAHDGHAGAGCPRSRVDNGVDDGVDSVLYISGSRASAHLGRTWLVFDYPDIRFLSQVCHLLVRCITPFNRLRTQRPPYGAIEPSTRVGP